MRYLLPALLLFSALFCFQRAFQSIAYADDTGSGSSASTAPAQPMADQLHDPVSSPAAAFDDLKAAKKIGWLVAVLAGLVLLGKGLARASQKFAFLGKGKSAVVIALIGTTAAGCYNAAASGGSWTAVLIAAVVGIAHYQDATPVAASS